MKQKQASRLEADGSTGRQAQKERGGELALSLSLSLSHE